MKSTWHSLTVGACFANFPWQGVPPRPTATAIALTKPWFEQSVQEFFQSQSWQGALVSASGGYRMPTVPLAAPTAASTVAEFFRCLPWTGAAPVAIAEPVPLPAPLEIAATEEPDEISLADLSDLF